MENQTGKTPAYSYYALALLMVVYILNFLDRTIIYILFPLIKKEMAFSDTQLRFCFSRWRGSARRRRMSRKSWA